jgi:histone deacetylase 11
MRWYYAAAYDYARNLPEHKAVHGFVLDRATRIQRHLITADVVSAGAFEEPEPVGELEVGEIHEPVVIYDLHDPYAVSRAVEFDAIALLPHDEVWQAVVAPQLLAAGGTCAALRAAVDGEWAINLSGGFHHARPDMAHGFCLLNDVALAVHRLRKEGLTHRILIVDLDLHQGDGNAFFFANDDSVFTFSMHERSVFPVPKATSDLDLGLESGTGDVEYLEQLEGALAQLRERCSPDLLLYVAGSDPFVRDPLGSLRLTPEGLAERDARVARFAAELGIPLVALPAGGYSEESAALTAMGFAEIAAVERAACARAVAR